MQIGLNFRKLILKQRKCGQDATRNRYFDCDVSGPARGAILLIRKVAFEGGNLPLTAEWIGELSVERYRPMMRLLDGADLEFLRSRRL